MLPPWELCGTYHHADIHTDIVTYRPKGFSGIQTVPRSGLFLAETTYLSNIPLTKDEKRM